MNSGRVSNIHDEDPDNDSEVRFGFATDKVVSEEMLLEMRRRNAQAAIRALRELQRGEGDSGAAPRLPTIALPKLRRRTGDAVERKVRRRPGSIRRAETPSEVREAAARERLERERERGWMKGRPKPGASATHEAKQKTRHHKLHDEEDSEADSHTRGPTDYADSDRNQEAELSMALLDLQAEGRYTEVSLKRVSCPLQSGNHVALTGSLPRCSDTFMNAARMNGLFFY